MQVILIALIIGLFCGVLFLNIYFRVKVLKSYKILVQNRVEFNAMDVFNMERIKKEVVPKYPQHEEVILRFINNIRFSVRCASLLIVLISAFAAVLMFMREGT